MKAIFLPPAFLLLFILYPLTSHSALLVRDLDGNAANGYEGVYDDVLNITWLANANAGAGSTYDTSSQFLSGSDTDGLMSWQDASNWAANFEINGIVDWRLPSLTPVNGTSFQVDFSSGRIYDGSQDASFNVGQVGSLSEGFLGSEFAYHFYINLGAKAVVNVDGSSDGSPFGIVNASNTANLSLFHNIQDFAYWLGLEYSDNTFLAWDFFVSDGFQDIAGKGDWFSAWAVHDGDIGAAAVPIPGAAWLFGSAIIGLARLQKIKK